MGNAIDQKVIVLPPSDGGSCDAVVNRKSWNTEEQTWEQINWNQVNRKVYKLQKRIYEASKRGDKPTIKHLQKTLTSSWAAKLLAVRKVTQENRGKKTAGIDGIKEVSPQNRMILAQKLKLSHKAKPAKRVWIPKPGKLQKRPLGIPVMEDRAKQALIALALEPEWEAKFETNSYGFRKGYRPHDAVETTFLGVGNSDKEKWVLDADISGCFDNISHEYLLEKLDTCTQYRKQIKAWLKAGVIDWTGYQSSKGYQNTQTGTPQGGVISPLLANIALNGLETTLREWVSNNYKEWYWSNSRNGWEKLSKFSRMKTLTYVRFADDFIIMHKDIKVVEQLKEVVKEFLAPIGLKLNEEKTKIVSVREGFDFLGFTIRQHKVGEYRSNKNSQGKRTGYKTLLTPSKKAVERFYETFATRVDELSDASQETVIKALNPIIKGWVNYYKHCNASETFSKLNHLIWSKIWKWSKRRHPNKGLKWIARKYFDFHKVTGKRWVFIHQKNDSITTLYTPTETKVERYYKVKPNASIYDGNLGYWATRTANLPTITNGERKILKDQKGKCPLCQQYLIDGDRWEIDHIIPKFEGGKSRYDNLQIIHLHCHKTKCRDENRKQWETEAINKAMQIVNQEPCEGKLSRTVLKTSDNGNITA